MSTTISPSRWLSRAIRKQALGQAVDQARLDLELASGNVSRGEFDRLVADDRASIHRQRNEIGDQINTCSQELVAAKTLTTQSRAKLNHARFESDRNGIEQPEGMVESIQADYDKHSAREQSLIERLEALHQERERINSA